MELTNISLNETLYRLSHFFTQRLCGLCTCVSKDRTGWSTFFKLATVFKK